MSLLNDASLILVPSAIRTGELLVQKPLPNKFADETGNYDGNDPQGSANLTFTRASNASRVNADGLVERVRTNLILRSNNFSNTWGLLASTATSGQTDKDGGTDAWLISWGATQNTSYVYQSISNLSTPHTASCWVKGTAGQKLRFGYGTNVGQGAEITFSGEWQRISHTSSSGSLFFFSNFITGFASSFYVQYCQSEAGDIATDYLETTTSARSTFAGITVDGTSVPNVPRLDYSGGASCPSLLLEPQRTNNLAYSQDIANAYWSKSDITFGADGLSPSGLIDADLVITGTNNSDQIQRSIVLPLTNTITQSVFIKRVAGDWIDFIAVRNGFANSVKVWFNISTGQVGGNILSGTTSLNSASIENYGNGWLRLIVTTTDTINNTNFDIRLRSAVANSSDTRFNNASYYVYGFQLEEGSYSTSLISTQGSAVTRLADYYTRSITPIASGSAFINITDNVALGAPGTHLYGPFALTSASLGLHLSRSNGTRLRLWTAAGAVIYSTTQTNLKLAITWNGTNVNVWENGVKVKSNYAYALTNVNQFVSSTSIETTSSIAQILMFNSVLTDAQLAELTTL